MTNNFDPWQIDIRKIKLGVFTQSDGRPIDPRLPFSVDEHFSSGIYCYGPKLRSHSCGEVSLALDMKRGLVVEIDRLALDMSTPKLSADIPLMKDLVLVSGLRHRHLPEILGSGVSEDLPFVVRPFRLGKTLAEVLQEHQLTEAVMFGLNFVTATVLDFLEQSSPFPGACAMGGLRAENLYLSYDGQISLIGLGYKSLRSSEVTAKKTDLSHLVGLAEQLDLEGKYQYAELLGSSNTLSEAVLRLRKLMPDACAGIQGRVAAMFRSHFAGDLQKDRAFFGLPTLQ